MDSYTAFVPEAWASLIAQDDLLHELFTDFSSKEEPVPPFLFQSLRGGQMARLAPICALYGQPGAALIRGLQEIDDCTRDTASVRLPDGQTAYAGYFFVRGKVEEETARAVARDYLHAVNRVYAACGEPPLLDENAEITLRLTDDNAIQKEQQNAYIHASDCPDPDIYSSLGDWFGNLPSHGQCAELAALFSEPLYHIANDYFLSYYLQWPFVQADGMENPFLPHYQLWSMGLQIYFRAKDQIVLFSA